MVDVFDEVEEQLRSERYKSIALRVLPILGGVLAWLILGSMISPVVMAAIMAAVAGIMVALSVDELMPLAKEIDPNNNPSYGVLCGMSVMGFSLVLLQTAGIG